MGSTDSSDFNSDEWKDLLRFLFDFEQRLVMFIREARS